MKELLHRIVNDNRQAREQWNSVASRTVAAIQTGDIDELIAIVRDVSGGGEEDRTEAGEAGTADGTAGIPGTAESPAHE